MQLLLYQYLPVRSDIDSLSGFQPDDIGYMCYSR
jgi:hypothetical protein